MQLFKSFKRSESLDRTARKPDDVQRIWVESQELVWRVVGRCWPYQKKGTRREVAHRVGCSQRSVSDILKKKQRLIGCVRDRKILNRKRKTSKEDRIIVRKSKADRFKSAPEIKDEMQAEHGVCISSSTTRRS